MEFGLTEEQRLIKQTAKEFADEKLAPLAAEYDRTEEFTAPQAKMLGEMGFLGMMVPEEYGGAGLDTISYVLAMEEVSRGCASTSVTMTVQNSLVCWPITYFGNEEQKRYYLPRLASGEMLGCYGLSEPSAGSDPASMATTATRGRRRLHTQRLQDFHLKRRRCPGRDCVGSDQPRAKAQRNYLLPCRRRHARLCDRR